MPTPTLKLVAAAALLLPAVAAHAQTDECEKLKIDNAKLKFENANLKKGIIARSPNTVPVPGGNVGATPAAPVTPTQGVQRQTQTVNKIDFTIVKCQGNAKAQTVTVTLLLTNAAANQHIQFENVRAIDEQGEEYKTYDIYIGSERIAGDLPTGVPIKTTFIIPKILPSVKLFKVLQSPIYNAPPIEFRDVAITWK